MPHWAVFATETGRIHTAGFSTYKEDALAQAAPWGEGFDVALGDEPFRIADLYMEGRQAVARPKIISQTTRHIAAGAGTMRAELPIGTVVTIQGHGRFVCEDGLLEFATSIPGEYRIEIDPPFPYQQQVVTVHAD